MHSRSISTVDLNTKNDRPINEAWNDYSPLAFQLRANLHSNLGRWKLPRFRIKRISNERLSMRYLLLNWNGSAYPRQQNHANSIGKRENKTKRWREHANRPVRVHRINFNQRETRLMPAHRTISNYCGDFQRAWVRAVVNLFNAKAPKRLFRPQTSQIHCNY